MQRDPQYFSYPEIFWPDRWLIAAGLQDSAEKIYHETRAFLPFSFGPSNCVGKQLAMKNMRTIVCHVVQKLQFKLPEGITGEDLVKEFPYRSGKLPVVVEPRD